MRRQSNNDDKNEDQVNLEIEETSIVTLPQKRRMSLSKSTSDLPSVKSSQHLFFSGSDSAISSLANTKEVKLDKTFNNNEIENFLAIPPQLKITKNINEGQKQTYIMGLLNKSAYLNDVFYHSENNLFYNKTGKAIDKRKMFVIVKEPITHKLQLRIADKVEGHFYLAINEEKVKERIEKIRAKHPELSGEKLNTQLRKELDLTGIECMDVVAAGELYFEQGQLSQLTVKSGCFHVPLQTSADEISSKYAKSISQAIDQFDMFQNTKKIYKYEEIAQLDEIHPAKKTKNRCLRSKQRRRKK